jgi:K319L-like, PKD domain
MNIENINKSSRVTTPLNSFSFFSRTIYVLLFAGLTACGSDDDDSNDNDPGSQTDPAAQVQPVASVETALNVKVGEVISLDGSESSASSGRTISYDWDVTTPTGSMESLDNDSAVMPRMTTDAAGVYQFSLQVDDGQLSSDAATITVTATAPDVNAAPNAVVTTSGNRVTINSMVNFSGEDSYDPDSGDISGLTFDWSLNTPSNSNSTATLIYDSETKTTGNFVPDKAGDYTLTLTVTDEDQSSSQFSSIISVSDQTMDVAVYFADDIYVVNDVITVDGSESVILDGNNFVWSFVSVPDGSVAPEITDSDTLTPSFSPVDTGFYTLQLAIVGADSTQITYAKKAIYISPPEPAPGDFAVTSFTALADCENLDIDYEVAGKTINITFNTPYELTFNGDIDVQFLSKACVLQFKLAGVGLDDVASYTYQGTVHTEDTNQGIVTGSARFLGQLGRIGATRIDPNQDGPISGATTEPNDPRDYPSTTATAVFRSDLTIIDLDTSNVQDGESFLRINSAQLIID